MARAARSREEEEREVPEHERPLDSGTVQALREADPESRAQAILRLQRLHGNAAVQRVIRSLQVTDASRDARIQLLGDRAEEPTPSGRLEKAELYREAIEAELDAAPVAARSERDLVIDSVNTIGQIFANYQAALHLFEEAVGSGAGEAVPRELAREVLREAARDVLEPVFDAASETAGEVAEHVARGVGTVDRVDRDAPRTGEQSAPVYALTTLVTAERRRIAATQRRLLKAQVRLGEHGVAGGNAARARLVAANGRLNELEEKSHSAGGIFKALMDRYKAVARGTPQVRIVLDPDWQVIRAHIAAPDGRRLASQLLADHSSWFPLDALHLPRLVTWEPAELATCEAVIDAQGAIRGLTRNAKGRAHFDEFQARLRDGLPHTRVLSGD